MFRSFKCWLFTKIAPWYAKEIKREADKLPHEKRCSSKKGPYMCDCAKRNLDKILKWIKEK